MRKIRKFYGKLWTKIIAMLLCMVSVVGLAGSGLGLVICGVETREQWQRDLYEKIEYGYSLLAMKHYLESDYAKLDNAEEENDPKEKHAIDEAGKEVTIVEQNGKNKNAKNPVDEAGKTQTNIEQNGENKNTKNPSSVENKPVLEVPELENTNFAYAILKSEYDSEDKIDFSNADSYVIGEPMEDYDRAIWAGRKGASSIWGEFNTDSLISALFMNDIWIDHFVNEDIQATRIDEFVFSRREGMIFAKTEAGYFPLDNFDVYRSVLADEDEEAETAEKSMETQEEIRKAIDDGNSNAFEDESQEEAIQAESDEAESAEGEFVPEEATRAGADVAESTEVIEVEEGAVSSFQMGEEEIYPSSFNYQRTEDGACQAGNDWYRPDVNEITEEYLKDSLYIYFHDEVLYWNKEDIYKLCNATSLGEVKSYFGDSVWSLKFVNHINKSEIKEASNFKNVSDVNRGWVYYDKNNKTRENYWIVCKYVENAENDLFAEANRWIELVFSMQDVYGLVLILSIFVFFAAFIYLMAAAGVHEGEEGICLSMWHRIPWGIYTGGIVGVESLIGVGLVGWIAYGSRVNTEMFWLVTMIPIVMLFTMIGVLYCMNTSVRIKSKTFWRYTVLYYLMMFTKKRVIKPLKKAMKLLLEKMVKPLKRAMKYTRENASLMRKTIIVLVIVYSVELLVMVPSLLACGVYDDGVIVVLIFLYTCLSAVKGLAVILAVKQMQMLQEGSRRIAAGNLEQPIDTSRMFWEFKKHGENINSVGDGINAAVQERMKSEHFKTELITNVSHDIKTPLTSIINYVDLMKKQDITDATMLEYMDVLDRQSARLKKLIEDLMEASKASTGNLTVNWEKMDVTVLLTQVVGEFEERLNAKGLELIVDSPNPPIYIRADGRHLWRVFDNLMNNICKYAQTGTRVYINMSSLAPEANQVSIVFRNISACQLNISSEELMERFVRGDSSRNTEGSGLGLSIAQSLTELMHGTLELNVDGDLFKVILQFPLEG